MIYNRRPWWRDEVLELPRELREHTGECMGAVCDAESIAQGNCPDTARFDPLLRNVEAALGNERNIAFFAALLKRLNISGVETLADIRHEMTTRIADLRALEVFGIGDATAAKEFFFALHRTIYETWRLPEKRYVA